MKKTLMTFFDYAYKLEAVRGLLFAQSKQSASLLRCFSPVCPAIKSS